MNKVSSMEHGAAAGAALLITLIVVWAFASLGYPAPADAATKPGVAASENAMHCRSG